MSLTPNDHTIEKELRDLKRRISALERANNSVGDLSEIAGSLTLGNGNVIIDDTGISLTENLSSDYDNEDSLKWVDQNKTPVAYIYQRDDTSSPVNRSLVLAVVNGSSTETVAEITTDSFIVENASITTITMGSTGTISGGNVAIADDGVYSFTPACARGVLILRGPGGDSTTYAMLTYAAISGTAYAYAWVNGSNTVITTGALTGTTGTDGKLTISAHTDGKIYIENRRGGSRAVAWNILAGV